MNTVVKIWNVIPLRFSDQSNVSMWFSVRSLRLLPEERRVTIFWENSSNLSILPFSCQQPSQETLMLVCLESIAWPVLMSSFVLHFHLYWSLGLIWASFPFPMQHEFEHKNDNPDLFHKPEINKSDPGCKFNFF